MTDNINTAPLTIKTDENNKSVPLGIKSVAQGIEHFTNWDNLSNSIDKIGRFRREDSFKNNNRVTTATDGFSHLRDHRVDDTWDVNKVQIIDDLAFVAEDEYTDVERVGLELEGQARQYFVERTIPRRYTPDVEDPDEEESPGFAVWNITGQYTALMPFVPPDTGGPFPGSLTIKYIPSTATWEVSGNISDGGEGWGGEFSGTAVYEACSGGGATNVDVTISGSHLCTASSAIETFSGTVRLNITPGNSSDEATCAAAITINSVSWGTPSQYISGGLCIINFSTSTIVFGGYTPPVTSTKVILQTKVRRRIGSLVYSLGGRESNAFQEYAFIKNFKGDQDLITNPTEGDFSNVYIKISSELGSSAGLSNNYLRFGGFVANDFCKSNDFVRRDSSKIKPDFKPEIFRDTFTLTASRIFAEVPPPAQCGDKPNKDFLDLPPIEFTNDGLEVHMATSEDGVFGAFLPPDETQVDASSPLNYSFLNAQPLPSWNEAYKDIYDADSVDGNHELHKQLLFGLAAICEEDLGNPDFGVSGENYTRVLRPPLNDIINPSDSELRDYTTYLGGNHGFQDIDRSFGTNDFNFRESWIAQQDRSLEGRLRSIQPLGEDTDSTLYRRLGGNLQQYDIPRSPVDESEVGRYYLIVDDSDPERPFISGVQFDFCLNSPEGGESYYTDESSLSDFQKGLKYANVPIKMEFIKFLPVRQCGKIDIYKRKSGSPLYVPQINPTAFSLTNHGYSTGDIIKISGALYKENGAAIRDTHPLNGFFKVQVIDKNIFFLLPGGKEETFNNFGEITSITVWNDPPTRADMELLRFLNPVTGEMGDVFFANSSGRETYQREGEGWSYQGTIFSPTGKNGYFNRLCNVAEEFADNVLANENEFYTTSRIDISDLTKDNDPSSRFLDTEISGVTQELGYLSFSDSAKRNSGFYPGGQNPRLQPVGDYGRGWVENYSLLIKRLVEAVPETSNEMRISTLGSDALNFGSGSIKNLSLGPDQIYPYVQREAGGSYKRTTNYKGCRFGCDFKVQKLEDGTYTIAVGEKGSDISVNLFGMDEYPIENIDGGISYIRFDEFCSEPTDSDTLKFRTHRRYIPEYLPYGKTHIINVTVDSDNNVSSVSHENSLFGGGHSIKSAMNENIISGRSEHSLEKNPWSDLEIDFRINKGESSFSRISEISSDDILISEQDFLDKNYVVDRSRYWQRHAVMHWYPQPIPEILGFREYLYGQGGYGNNRDPERNGSSANPSDRLDFGISVDSPDPPLDWPHKRNFIGAKRTMSDGVGLSDYVSIFGDDPNIISIDRFNINKDPKKKGYWSIFPWVDSFGKSVGLSIDSNLKDVIGSISYSNDSKMTVLSASTSRCNIDITDEVQQPIANLTRDQIKPGDGRYRVQDSESQIGQLNAHFVYKQDSTNDYNVVDYMQINSAGSMGGRYRRALNRKYKRRRVFDPSDRSSIRYTQLPKGTYAGHGIAEVMTSCFMSYSDIVFDKDRIIFSEQSLGENKSIIHIFDFDASSTLPFKRNHTIERQFNFERNSEFTTDENKEFEVGVRDSGIPPIPLFKKAIEILERNIFNVGDGFGMTIRADKDLLLTNATDTVDEFGEHISRANFTGFQINRLEKTVQWGIDQIFLYEKFKDTFEFSQKITPTITSDQLADGIFDDSEGLRDSAFGWFRNLEGLGLSNQYSLVPLAAMNYDNVPNGTFAWVLQLAGRYDLADTRIVLQDPHAVAIFDRDFSESQPMIGVPFARNPELTSAKIETFDHRDTSKLTYEPVTGSRTRSGASQNLYDCRLNIEDYQKPKGKYHELPEQVPILNYSLEGDEDVYINEMTIKFDLIAAMDDISTTFTPRVVRRVDQPLVPRIVLYNRDPSTIVTRNISSKIIERDSNISNFYTLDTSKKTKKLGGFIAPTKSASDFDNPIVEGNTFYNDVRATRTHRDAGFMGQFRGGAQDLFFYGTLEGSVPENAQEVFGGSEPRTTLPYLYGGKTNLADFTGGCSWIAPDVYHKYTLDQISQIKPYAKIFNPVKQSDGTYSVTLTSQDINFSDFINKGTGGIWIGFVLTNINKFDINRSIIDYEEFESAATRRFYPDMRVFSDPVQTYDRISAPSEEGGRGTPLPDPDIGPFRYILAATRNGMADSSFVNSTGFSQGFIKTVTQNWINARYPYCRVGVYPAKSSGKGSQTQIRNIDRRVTPENRGSAPKSLSCFAEATVKNPEIELKGLVTTGRRYKTSFSKRAVVSLKDILTQPTFDGDSSAVVAIGKSEKTPSIDAESTVGNFSRSYQIITATDGYITDPDKEQRRGEPTRPFFARGNQYDQPRLRHSNILSSFDIVRPDYLSLTINGLRAEENIATLFTPTASAPASGLASLVLAPAQDSAEKTTTLFTGIRDFDGAEPLFLSNKLSENKFTLNINEIQPSAVVPFFTKTVNASGGIDLAFAPPTTGSAPLFVTGPIAASGLAPLNTVGGAFMDEVFTLRLSGAFHSSGDAPLFTNSHFDASGTVDLAFAPPITGSMPLYLNNNPEASGQATLTIFDKASGVQDVNLFIGDQFDVENNNLSLLLDGFTFPTGQAPLNTTGFALTANSNRNSSSSFLVGLPDNEFDKGDPNGDFNEDPISKTLSGKIFSSNSVMANAIDENFYEYNRNIVTKTVRNKENNQNISVVNQTDPNSPVIFTRQRRGGNAFAPSLKKKGTLDPAYNLALGENTRSSNRFSVQSGSTINKNVDLVRKFYLNSDYSEGNSASLDLFEKSFYDANENILAKGAIKDENIIEIGIYDIDDDGNMSQRGDKGRNGILRFAPADALLNDLGSVEHGYVFDGVQNYQTGSSLGMKISQSTNDPFYVARRKIFKKVKDDAQRHLDRTVSVPEDNLGKITKAFWKSGKIVDIFDIKVSKNNKCAISFAINASYDFYYKNKIGRTTRGVKFSYSRIVNVVLVFDITKFNPDLSYGGFLQNNPFRNVRNEYHTIILPDQSALSGVSIAFDYDDLYVSSQGVRFGEILKFSASRNYIYNSLDSIKFENLSDSSGYKSLNNAQYIAGSHVKPFFGSKVKIFDEYDSDKSIMLVGSMLFDPYLFNTLSTDTGVHRLNPVGAVYIFKKQEDENSWTYHGAVYSKGYTSANIQANLSEYSGGRSGSRRVSLFGYDFDYSEGVLSVSEPGGDGSEGVVSTGRVYNFNISSTPSLVKSFVASDLTINSSAIARGDNFGTSIVSFGGQDVFTFSDSELNYLNLNRDNLISSSFRYQGESLVHNLRNNSSFGFGSSGSAGNLKYNRQNDFSELRPYFTDKLKSGAYPEFSSVMQVWSRILSVKKLSAKNKDRLLIVRKFGFRLNSAEGMTDNDFHENSFNVVKLQVVDLERSVNGTLFIKAPDSADSGSSTPLFTLAPGPSGNFNMVVKPIDFASGLPSLFIDNRSFAQDMSLHTPRVDNVLLPLAVSGFAPSAANQAKLFMKHQVSIATPDLFMPAIGIENGNVSLAAQGSAGEGLTANTSLVINRHIPGVPEFGAATLFLNQTDFKNTTLFVNNAGSDNPAIDLVVGSPLFGSPSGSIPLSVKTFTPPIVDGVGFVGSGIISIAMSGNNDAGVYNKHNGDTSLVLAAKNITDSQNVLFIEKSFGGLSPLYMDSRIASGDVVLNVEGTNIQESNINLNTRGGTALVGLSETGNFSAFTRGWFD